MFRRRREVVPGLDKKLNAFLSQVLHRELINHMAGLLLERANLLIEDASAAASSAGRMIVRSEEGDRTC